MRQRDQTLSPGWRRGLDLKPNPDLIGYEVAWYDIRNRQDGPGFRIVPGRSFTLAEMWNRNGLRESFNLLSNPKPDGFGFRQDTLNGERLQHISAPGSDGQRS